MTSRDVTWQVFVCFARVDLRVLQFYGVRYRQANAKLAQHRTF